MNAAELNDKMVALEQQMAEIAGEHDARIGELKHLLETFERELKRREQAKHSALAPLHTIEQGFQQAWQELSLEQALEGIDERVRPEIIRDESLSDHILVRSPLAPESALLVGHSRSSPRKVSFCINGRMLVKDFALVCECCKFPHSNDRWAKELVRFLNQQQVSKLVVAAGNKISWPFKSVTLERMQSSKERRDWYGVVQIK